MKEFLSQQQIAFEERNVAKDPAALDELEKLGYATTPVTVIDGEVVVEGSRVTGARPVRVLYGPARR